MIVSKQRICTVADFSGLASALAKLPSIVSGMLSVGKVDIVIREHQTKRSNDQNRLQRLWCKEAGEQGDMTAEQQRGYCKYHFGLAILCRDSEDYRAACKRVLGSLNYEQRIELMMEPHDYPVTRGMTKKQKTEYLDACWQHFTGLGMRLTDPNLRGMDDWRESA